MAAAGQPRVRRWTVLQKAWAARRLTTSGTTHRPFLLVCLAVVWLLVAVTLYVVILAPAYVVLDRYDVPDWSPPGGYLLVPGQRQYPALVFPLFALAVALASACLLLAVREASGPTHWLARIFVAFHGLDWGVELLFSFLALRSGVITREDLGASRAGIIAVGVAAVLASVLLAILPRRFLTGRGWLLGALAATPFLGYAVVFLAFADITVRSGSGISLGPGNVPFPEDATVAHWVAFWSMNQVDNLSWAAVVLVWWQAFEAARGARDLGLSSLAVLPRRGWEMAALSAVVLAKLAFAGVGCLGWLAWLGGRASSCEVVADDGSGSLLLAVVLVAGLGAWVVTHHRRSPFAREPRPSLVPAGWVLIAALSMWAFLANQSIRFDQVLRKVLLALGVDPGEGTSVHFAGNRGEWALVALVVACGVVGRLVWERWPGAAVLLILFAVWNAVRAVAVAAGLWQYAWMPWTFATFHDGEAGGPGWVDFYTVDLVLTVAVAVALATQTRAWRSRWSARLLPVIVATTVLAYSSELDLAGGLRQAAGVVTAGAALAVGLALVFPIVYTLLFDAEWIIEPRHRSARVAGSTALCLLVLGVLVVQPAAATAGVYSGLAGQMLAAPTLLAVLVVGLLSADRRASRGPAEDVPVDPQTAEDGVEHAAVPVSAGEQPPDHDRRPGPVDGDEGAHRPVRAVTAPEVPGDAP